MEYEHGQNGLAAEHTNEELSWSRSTPVAEDQVRACFKLPVAAKPTGGKSMTQADVAWRALLWILGLNFVPLIFNFTGTIFWLVVGLVALFLPMMLSSNKK